MKCSNCLADAVYVISDPGVSPAYYCAKCLPEPLRARANSGQLDLPKAEEPKEKPAKKKAAEKASEPVEEATDENTEA